MSSKQSFATLRRALLGATSITAALTAATAAQGQERPTGSEESPAIIVNNTLNPNTPPAGGVLDSGVTGVGQMISFVQSSPTAAGLSLCTGTLINPRTVIFAAHCVNTRPAHQYGSQTGTGGGVNGNFGAITSITNVVNRAPLTSQGVPISFGFQARNRCTDTTAGVNSTVTTVGNGCQAETGAYETWRNGGFNTNTGQAIYNVNQVWYDLRSLGPNSAGFIEGDIALATLDTPAFDVPTWTMLLTPLTSETHSLSMGYGVSGSNATAQGPTPCTTNCSVLGPIDYRRRVVENTLSVLGSLQDRNAWLFGSASAGPNFQSLYMQDFDSPEGQGAGFDFDVFNGAALPREGTTAGGDSGGPLVIDQRFDRPVTAGTLSGGSRFFNGQRFSTYGTHNFYQPLFLFWDAIVANNSYAYVGAKAGNGNWEDGSHWVQLMDPNYAIEVNGALVNSLPDTPALGVSGNTVKFGEVCFLDDCTDLADDDTATAPPVGNGTPILIAGGPGSTNFVPDNVNPVNSADPALSVKARYYDVTLSEAGTTTLSSARTVDALTLDGAASKLKIASGGSLNVLGEVNQWQGWTQVDGLLKSGRDTFIGSGILSGSGTIQAPFVTVAAAVVAPGGGDKIGTLTINGNTILSSGSSLFIDALRGSADRLAVGGALSLSDSAGAASLVFNKVTDGAAPRHGDRYTIATASGGIIGTFGQIYSFQGVLRPALTYNANSVVAELRAGSLVEILDNGNATEIAFASALDALRASSYNSLYGLYGAVDLMDSQRLSATLNGLNPTIIGETRSLNERQSRVMLNAIGDRLSMLGSRSLGGTLSIVGQPYALVALGSEGGIPASAGLTDGLQPAQTSLQRLPKGMSGFISGGFSANAASYGESDRNSGQRSWHIGMGLEMEVAENATLGTAFGYSNGYSLPGVDRSQTDSRMVQAAAYGSYRFGDGAYIAGLAAAERSRAAIDRTASTGEAMFDLAGATTASRYSIQAEAGVNMAVGRGLTLTPRAGLSYASYSFGGYRETGGELALRIDDLNLQRLDARIGAKLAGSMPLAGGWTFVPQLQADYVHSLSGADDGMKVRFAAAPDYAFLLPLAGGDGSWAEVRGGMKLTNGPFEFGAGLESSLGRSDYKDDRAVADFTFRF